ncbi:Sporulation related domain-containing protein [Desulfomicrobium norvegicum]|uniref:Sporulation related domain-containing protein n=1 Tax=Desulfomicrobium norvegicum (strain DSM 1741 / NCIMB 8310) TaxID=52561 RepID=A0A8G2F790_DESNO|nr:SPOR domain-containing protein [Desulfomicrobium norvegicum]SFL65156.1 Sporulation related domain-containing protein [Desulfomicrobium norvegicum]
MITRKSSTTKKKDKNKLSFQLGLSGFLSLAVLVVIGMAWSFILGVIVGRGYQPEKMAMEMAQKVLPEDFPLLTEKNEEVLKGEELEFFDKLKQGPTSVAPAPAPQAKAPTPPQPKPQAAAASKPEQSPIDAALQSAAAVAGQSPATAAKPAKEEVFVFNYQVAALASMEQAQTFLKKLDPAKFKTSVVTATHEGKTWYRVYVHHQGTVDSALALKEQLKGSGIGGVLLRSRTPL